MPYENSKVNFTTKKLHCLKQTESFDGKVSFTKNNFTESKTKVSLYDKVNFSKKKFTWDKLEFAYMIGGKMVLIQLFNNNINYDI